jgi:anti-anti-sigma factor
MTTCLLTQRQPQSLLGAEPPVADALRRDRAQAWPALVAFPAEVDVCNTRRLGHELGLALTSAATVIADLTATTFCDCSGARVLLVAYEQAAADGIELRLVVSSARVLRLLALTGADRLPPIYPTVKAALDAETSARTGPMLCAGRR